MQVILCIDEKSKTPMIQISNIAEYVLKILVYSKEALYMYLYIIAMQIF